MAIEDNASSTNVTPERDTDRKRTRCRRYDKRKCAEWARALHWGKSAVAVQVGSLGILEVRREALLHPYRVVGECRWQFSSRCLSLNLAKPSNGRSRTPELRSSNPCLSLSSLLFGRTQRVNPSNAGLHIPVHMNQPHSGVQLRSRSPH